MVTVRAGANHKKSLGGTSIKHTKKLWALVLALVMALALSVTAVAETAEIVGPNPLPPGNTPTGGEPITAVEVEIKKTVELAGEGTIPAATFTFVLTDPDGRSLSDCGIAVRDDKVTLAEGENNGTTAFVISVTDADKIRSTWTLDGNNGYAKTFRLTEKSDGAAGWTYDGQSYDIALTYSAAGDLGCNEATKMFRNVYTPTKTVEIPFTKVVKLGGNTAPDKQTFELEIFNSVNPTDGLTITSAVETNGRGTYEGKLVITGPGEKVDNLIGRGFYVREKSGDAANWTYSDAVWHVIKVDGQNKIYPATKKTSDNGDYYEDGAAVEKMTFTNTYTRNTSSTVYPTQPPTPISSPKTFDAGIGVYAVSALLSVTGGAWLVGKKHK